MYRACVVACVCVCVCPSNYSSTTGPISMIQISFKRPSKISLSE